MGAKIPNPCPSGPKRAAKQPPKRVRFITSSDGDWVAMYIDGRQVAEGHSIDGREMLKLCGIKVISEEVDVDPYDTGAAFPSKIDMATGKAID